MPYTLAKLVQFAEAAGFQGDQAKTIAAIAMAESSGRADAVNYADPGGSYGLTQINAGAHGPSAMLALNNPQEAFKQAYRISAQGTNFTPWSTFTNGMYLPHATALGLVGGSTAGSQGGGAISTVANALGIGSGSGGSQGSLSGANVTGYPNVSQSPLSAIFAALGNFMQTAGVLILGVVLVAIGAWWIAKPKS